MTMRFVKYTTRKCYKIIRRERIGYSGFLFIYLMFFRNTCYIQGPNYEDSVLNFHASINNSGHVGFVLYGFG